VLLACVLAPAISRAGEKQIVPAEEAAAHVTRWNKPEYPALARVAHLQGDVVIQVSISKTGAVSNARVKSGHPMLAQLAVEAVQEWRFRPFEVEGKTAAVEALLKIQFPPGDSPEEIKESPEKIGEFSSVISTCRDDILDHKPVEAEPICRNAIALANALGPRRRLEKLDAYQQTGHALFLQNKFAEALENYQQELLIANQAVEPHGAEIAAAHRHVGNSLWGTGQKEEARVEYEQAENVYAAAEGNTDSTVLKNEYAKNRKAILHDHAVMLRQMGQNEEAEFLERQSAAIVIKN
jgi:TonB family protein